MITTLLVALCAGTPPSDPALFVRGSVDFEPVATHGQGAPIILPLLSRSEREQRAVRTAKGIGFRAKGKLNRERWLELVQVRSVEHADGERIAVDMVERSATKLSKMRLPRSVTRSGSDAEFSPWTARLDGIGVDWAPQVDAGSIAEGESLIEFFVADEPYQFSAGVELGTELNPTLQLVKPQVDQLLIARVEPISESALPLLELRDVMTTDDGFTEAWYASPSDARQGFTTTLVVRADLPEWKSDQSPSPAKNALFHDVSRAAGIDMVHMEGPDLQLDIRPTMGPGAAWGDVDGDGWVDLFLPQGGGHQGTRAAKSKLYRNRGDGTFEDVSEKSGLALEGAGMGALFFDADGDVDLDLFVANFGRNRFLVNDGHGHFQDESAAAGLATDRWHAAVSASDYDRDGDLDLYVTSYLVYDESQMPTAEELGRYQREDPIAMLPYAFPGEQKSLLRNDRNVVREAATKDALSFHFTDVAQDLALTDASGRGMQAIFWDFDRDGDQDLYLANDVSPNRFWRNEGNGKWKDIAFSTGVDDPRGSMGLAVGDVDGDGDEDLFVTNWQLESNALYVNSLVNKTSAKSRVATFRDNAIQAGLGQLSVGVTKWGCELADFDLDRDLDLAYANGYTSPDYESTGICVGQPNHYFENDGEGRFTAAFEKAGTAFTEPLSSRCLLACDYDQDGDLDLVVTANNGRVKLLRNDVDHRGRHWLGVRLRGADGNTHAIGAEVEIEIDGKTLRRSLRAGTSYLGGNAPELHFGLGSSTRVTTCRVKWPDGKTTSHEFANVDRFVVIQEP